MKNIFIIGVIAVLLLLGGSWWTKSSQSKDSNVIATGGIHWHPQLEIYMKGVKQDIPANVGIGAVHQPIHTHDDMPVLHLEFSGRVTKDDVKLGNFFRIWGKDMRSFGANMTMTVNGEANTEFENYSMRDKDRIIINFE